MTILAALCGIFLRHITIASAPDTSSVQPLKFGGKELERRGGLNWHDFEARWLANGRFTAQDPKRETYYPLSPYAYCADNPIKYVDRDGREMNLPTDVGFNYKLAEARRYIGREFSECIQILRESDNVLVDIHRQSSTDKSYFEKPVTIISNGKKMISIDLYLNLDAGVELDNGDIVSASMVAYHEFKHVEKFVNINVEELDKVFYAGKDDDEQYDNIEERRVITNIEIPKAKELNEPIRTSHGYKNILPNDDVTYRKVNGVEYSNHQE